MPTPNPTIYLMLHHGHNRIDAYSDPGGTTPLESVQVAVGGQINVVFINNNNNTVETGNIWFGPVQGGTSPFSPANPNVNQSDNGNGVNGSSIPAQSPACIDQSAPPGSYPFTIYGSWNNGHHHVGQDPTVVVNPS